MRPLSRTVSSGSAAVEPCVPTRSNPIASRMRATLSAREADRLRVAEAALAALFELQQPWR